MTRLNPRPEPGARGEPLPRQDPVERLPVLILEPHSRCNCRCRMCDIWKGPRRDELSPEEVRRWLPEWLELGVRRIVLGGGEPLMHSELWDICAPLREAGIGLTLLSTGLLLERQAEPISRYIDDVIVSLDGPAETHDAIRRVPNAFARLAAGVRALRRESGALAVTARCTVQRANFERLRATVRAARELELDRISFLAVDTSSEAFNRPGGWSGERVDEVGLGPDELPRLEAELSLLESECAKEFDSGFIAETPEKLRRKLLQSFAARLGQGSFAPVECNAPWVSAVIQADGSVRPCFFFEPQGQLRETQSLRDILNAPAALEFRQALDTHTNPTCQRCVCSLQLRQDS